MQKNTVRRLVGYVMPYKMNLLLSILGALIHVICTLLIPVIIGKAIDYIIGVGQVDFASVRFLLILLALSAIGAAVFQRIMLVCTRNISALAAQKIRQDAFESINISPLKTIDTHSHGDIVSRLVNDADAISEGLLQALTQLFPGVVTIIATIALMLMLNVGIALLVIFATPLSIIFARFIGSRTVRFFLEQSVAQGRMGGYVNEMISNRTLVASLGYEKTSEEEFNSINDEYYEGNFKATFYSSISNPGTRFVNALVYAAVGLLGALTAIGGGITVGSLSAFLSYANQYTKPFNEITSVLTQIQAAFASAKRLFEIVDWEHEHEDASNEVDPQTCEGMVKVQNVFFSYTKDNPLIHDLNLEARPGMHFALVGPTGCGKTTLINLLMRFYDIDSGEISIDGIPIREIKRSSLRGLYGMVLQDSWLKQATVRENIAYGRPDADIREIKEAAKLAYAHNFIMRLPKGYDTVLQSGGGNLSEGQKQLISIARIMLAKPKMLILDEATSSIDTRTEMLIQRALEKLMEGRTSFIVAHRLSTIQNADCILLMQAGRVVERGTHKELLEQNGFYARLYNSQFSID